MYSNSNEPQLTISRSRAAEFADAPVPAAKEVSVSITGYRQLSAAEQDLINQIKAHAEMTGNLVTLVQHFVADQHRMCSTALSPERWAALAQTDLQTGFMKLVRAVAQPNSF